MSAKKEKACDDAGFFSVSAPNQLLQAGKDADSQEFCIFSSSEGGESCTIAAISLHFVMPSCIVTLTVSMPVFPQEF